MAFTNSGSVLCFKFNIILYVIVCCSILQPSYQDLFNKVLQQELEEELLSASASRISRQTKTVYDASGVEQSLSCGFNSFSFGNRRKRQDEPQGPYDWPWMAVILDKDGYTQFCGGTLLNHQYVLTAAHCFAYPGKEKKEADVVIRLGEWDLFTPDETKHQDIFPAKIEIHDNYEPSNQKNDIALVKLERSVEYNQYIRPLCLPNIDIKPNDTAIVAGWGAKETGSEDHSNILLDVSVPVIAHTECADLYGVSNSIDEKGNICAGGVGKDSCTGDSGGPLLVEETINDEKRWMIVGVVSWGLNCGEYTPGVYTNVRHYLKWIGTRILDAAP